MVTERMKVFISWSGERSRVIASAIREWLPKVLQAVQPWMSASDIEPGTRWSNEVSTSLQESRVGIICLTPDNLNEPWILFEAGALSKILDKAHVCTYLFGLEASELAWPLAMFQATKVEKESTKTLLQTINRALGELCLPNQTLDETFDVWWPNLELRLTSVPSERKVTPLRDDRALLEELITLTRTQSEATKEMSTLLRETYRTPTWGVPAASGGIMALSPAWVPATQQASLSDMFWTADEHGRQFRELALFRSKLPPDRVFEWRGFSPPAGQGWRYSKSELEKMLESGRITLGPNGPRMRKYRDEQK